MVLVNFWLYLVPPLAGGVIGYFTNDLAIKMLFRPYKAVYLWNKKLPFTPGLIPSNQQRLANKVSDTIMGSLLTPEELHKLAQILLHTDRVKSAILWLLKLALEQLQEDKEQKTVTILADILKDLLEKSLPRLLRVLARKEDFLDEQINQIFDQILLDFQLTEAQARQFSDWILDIIVPPDTIRKALIDFLTERNIQVIDEGFREKTSGTYWVVANLFGLRNSLVRLREFCVAEPAITNARLKELIFSLEIRNRIRDWLTNLAMENLPVDTVSQLRKTTQVSVRNYAQNRGAEFLENLGAHIDWGNISAIAIKRLRSSPIVDSSLEVVSQELALVLERYLENDLEKLVAQAIPLLSIDQVIINRVMETSPQELELSIQGIVKNELQAIVNLGGILGLTIGSLQTLILFLK